MDAKRTAASILRLLFGRRLMVRAGRYLSNWGRLDVPNDMRFNGELALLRRVLANRREEGATVVDIGANEGEWSVEALSLAQELGVRTLVLHAFEPHPGTRAGLERRLKSHPLGGVATVHEAAVSDSATSQKLHVVAPGAGTNSLYAQPKAGAATIDVRTTTLAEFARTHGLERLDLVKVDTEGHDPLVLRGMMPLLAEGRVGVVQFEYNHRWVFSRNYLRDVFELAATIPYVIGKVTPLGIEFYKEWDPELETFREANYVLCHEREVAGQPSVPWWNA
jgi:FkbM family methyltransferase